MPLHRPYRRPPWPITVAVLAMLTFAVGCSTPQDEIGGKIKFGTRDDSGSSLMGNFSQASAEFETAVQRFNASPTDGSDALTIAERRLRELRDAFDAWSPVVDEILDADIKGTPKPELRAWRDAAEEWIEAQEAITAAMVACDYELTCLERAQARQTPAVVAATMEAQEAKRRFVAAVPDE